MNTALVQQPIRIGQVSSRRSVGMNRSVQRASRVPQMRDMRIMAQAPFPATTVRLMIDNLLLIRTIKHVASVQQ